MKKKIKRKISYSQMNLAMEMLGLLIGVCLSVIIVAIIVIVYTPEHAADVQVIEYKISQDVSNAHQTIKVKAVEKQDVLEDNLEEQEWTDSLEYLAACVEAEAGNQSELGKRLVCDAILNRYDKGCYDTLYDVIDEPGQFSVVSDGRINKVIPSEDTYRIIQEELKLRTNTDVLNFREGQYHSFGTPLFVEGDHYFSM